MEPRYLSRTTLLFPSEDLWTSPFQFEGVLRQNCHSKERSDEESHDPSVKILPFTQDDIVKETFETSNFKGEGWGSAFQIRVEILRAIMEI